MGLERWVNQAVALGTFVALGRLLSTRDFGLIAAANVVILFLRVVVDQGFSQSLVQRKELPKSMIDTAFWTAAGTGLAFALIVAAGAPLVALVYHEPQLTSVVRVLAVIFIIVGLDSTQSALLDRAMLFRIQAIRRLCATAASAAVAITVAALGGGVWALVGQAVTLEAVTVILLWSLTSWRPGLRFDRSHFRELSAWGSRYGSIRILWFLGNNADNFLVGVFLGPLALGFYAIAFRVVVVVNELLALTITQVVLSTFSKLQHDREALNRAFYDSSLITGAAALPVYIGLAIAARPAVVLVFGAKWGPSAPILQLLAVAGAVQCQTLFSHNYAIAMGRLRSELRWTVTVVALELAGFAIAVPFGLRAIAASLGLVMLITWPARLIALRAWGGLSLRRYFSAYPALLTAGAAMAAAMLAVGASLSGAGNLALLVAQGMVGIVAFVATLRLTSASLTSRMLGMLALLRA